MHLFTVNYHYVTLHQSRHVMRVFQTLCERQSNVVGEQEERMRMEEEEEGREGEKEKKRPFISWFTPERP